jgi:predicted Zn-dependent peptidase
VAKRAAVLETLVRAESSSALAVDLAAQVLANGKTVSPNEFLSLVEQVTAEDVKKVRKIFKK